MTNTDNTRLTRDQAFEQGRSLGMDHAEAHEYADRVLEAQGSRMAQAARTADLTVRVHGTAYTLDGPTLDALRMSRNQSVLHKQARNARDAAFTMRNARNAVQETFGVSADTATMIMAAVRQAPVEAWRPESLDLAVRWSGRGWKLYTVTGTRHAYYLIRKLAQREGFEAARLNDVIVRDDRYILDNVIHLSVDDVTGSDRAGKYRALLDRNNSHYDLEHDALRD